MPSFLPKGGPAVALGMTALATIGAIYYSHGSQVWDREVMRAGVARDKERMRLKRQAKKQQQEREANNNSSF
jgi:hypothetical protein